MLVVSWNYTEMTQCHGLVDGIQPLQFQLWDLINSSSFGRKRGGVSTSDSQEVLNI